MTPKQATFVREYLIDLNATQAAIRSGYSAKTADQQASRLLANVKVAAAVKTAMDARAQKTDITAERVLEEYRRLAFYDPAEFCKENGIAGPADIAKLPEDVRRAIVGWGYDKEGNFQVKLADKKGALDSVARHLGMFNDKLEVTVKNGLADRVKRAKERGNG